MANHIVRLPSWDNAGSRYTARSLAVGRHTIYFEQGHASLSDEQLAAMTDAGIAFEEVDAWPDNVQLGSPYDAGATATDPPQGQRPGRHGDAAEAAERAAAEQKYEEAMASHRRAERDASGVAADFDEEHAPAPKTTAKPAAKRGG